MSTALFHDALLLNCICIMNSESAFSNLLNKKTFDQTHLQLSSVITRRVWSVDPVLRQYRLSSPSYIYVRDHCSFRYTTYMAITTCWSSACLSLLLLVILMIAVMILNRTDPFQPAPGKEWVRPAFPFNTSWSDRSIALAHLDSTHPRLACSTVMGIKDKDRVWSTISILSWSIFPRPVPPA